MNSSQIKCAVANWCRYTLQHYVVGIEAINNADVASCDKGWRLREYEVKISLSDLKRDIQKDDHQWIRWFCGLPYSCVIGIDGTVHHYKDRADTAWYWRRIPYEFYFALPESLWAQVQELITTWYPYAGVVMIEEASYRVPYSMFSVKVVRKPKRMNKRPLDEVGRKQMLKSQSATLCRTLELVERKAYEEKQQQSLQV